MKQGIRILLILILTAVFLFSGWKLLGIVQDYQEGESSYDALEQYVSFEAEGGQEGGQMAQEPQETVAAEQNGGEPMPDVSRWPQVDFQELAGINPDIVGWIYIPGTNINYPVVRGTDNDYYLNRLFDGTYNKSGCIFMDYRCEPDFSGKNSIIYGHHMKNGSMFASLMEYKEKGFYEEHSVALLVTPDAYYEIRLFSGYVADNWDSAWDMGLSGAEFEAWLKEICQKSTFEPVALPGADDRIVTLSTCTYEFADAKYVVHGYISEVVEKVQLEE